MIKANLSALFITDSSWLISMQMTSNTREQIITSTFFLKTSGAKTCSSAKLHSKIPVIDLFNLFSIEVGSSSDSNVAYDTINQ